MFFDNLISNTHRDNNHTEREIKRFIIARKNRLSDEAGKRNGAMHTF